MKSFLPENQPPRQVWQKTVITGEEANLALFHDAGGVYHHRETGKCRHPLCLHGLMGRDDLVEKYKGDSIEGFLKRAADQEMLNSVFPQWVKENMTAEDLENLFIAMDAPQGLVKDVKELLDDPHLKARNMIVDMDHPRLGPVKNYNIPIRIKDIPLGVQEGENPHDPDLGEHSTEILRDLLGKTEAEMEVLRKDGVIWI
ncbi:MAG: CoA transferase [Thermodesulfobacteriota bacterium]